MAYVITEACIDTKDQSCVDVCPVDCISADDADRMLFIDPDACIDCAACLEPCPVNAIFAQEDLPPEWAAYLELNELHFRDPAAARELVNALLPSS
ncbi:MAG: ferredoxin family protein [Actinomycetota bacterium]|nr:ferredoxin family protein [Actinomycetota bacterium]